MRVISPQKALALPDSYTSDIAAMYLAGMSGTEIAKQLGWGDTSVYARLRRAGVTLRHHTNHGAPPSRFSPSEEREIAALYADGTKVPELRRRFGYAADATFHAAVRRQGGTVRPRGYSPKEFPPEQVADMAIRWHASESQASIARSYGIDQATVSRILSLHGVQPVRNYARGEHHGHWQGDGHKHTLKGYVAVRVPDDSPFISMTFGHINYVLEHRLRVAESLGRPLLPSETVHHINGVKDDNRVENLQLRTGNHGTGVAMHCADCGSTNIVHVGLT